MERDPWEEAAGQVEGVAAVGWAGWVDPLRRDPADTVFVRNAVTGSHIGSEFPAPSRNARNAEAQWPGSRFLG
jgi:hypothetical protein